jgi:hypothetical protein
MRPTEINTEATRLLFENAVDFLNGGIELLFFDAAKGCSATIGEASIQTAWSSSAGQRGE